MNVKRWNAIKLPTGRVVGLHAYVAAFNRAKALPPDATVRGWQWFPVEAREVVRDYRRAIDDRVNLRGGLVVRTPSDARLLRLMRDRIKHSCRWCGSPLGQYRFEAARFCDADCRRSYTT